MQVYKARIVPIIVRQILTDEFTDVMISLIFFARCKDAEE